MSANEDSQKGSGASGKLRFALGVFILLFPALLLAMLYFSDRPSACVALPQLGSAAQASGLPLLQLDKSGKFVPAPAFGGSQAKPGIHLVSFLLPGGHDKWQSHVLPKLSDLHGKLEGTTAYTVPIYLHTLCLGWAADSLPALAAELHKLKADPAVWNFWVGDSTAASWATGTLMEGKVGLWPVAQTPCIAEFAVMADTAWNIRGRYWLVEQHRGQSLLRPLLEELDVLRCEYREKP